MLFRSRSAFPDLELDVVAIQGLHELNIRAIRKPRVHLNQGTVAMGFVWRRMVREDNTVRVANGRCTEPQDMTVDLKFFVQYFSRLTINRNNCAIEADLSHFHLHAPAVSFDLA